MRDGLDSLNSIGTIDQLWLMIATVLVLFMQAGFLFLESGNVRSKNTINVAQKNIADLIICGCVFTLIGGPIMFGAGNNGFIGFGGYDLMDPETRVNFLYKLAFCATAVTIISGAISERMNFVGYLLLTMIISAIVYPVFGHMVWGATLIADNPSFLADLGFLDFAGASVVHIIGWGRCIGNAYPHWSAVGSV